MDEHLNTAETELEETKMKIKTQGMYCDWLSCNLSSKFYSFFFVDQ